MTDRQLPRVATWLAHRLVPGPRRESLLGDLIEQYREGRSGRWYWRQVLVAIVVGNAHDLAAHRLLALRALTIGWILYYLFSFPVTWAGGIAENWVGHQVIVCEPTSFWCQFWRNQLSVELLIYVAAAVSGAIVARLHHTYRVAMLSLFTVSVLLFECGMIGWMVSQSVPPVPISRGALMLANLTVIARPLSVFIGGMWAARSDIGSTGKEPGTRSI